MSQETSYCGADIYDLYIAFERDYLRSALKHRPIELRKSFKKSYKIYTNRKSFWDWFDEFPIQRQLRLRQKWALGYDEYISQLENSFERLAHEDTNEPGPFNFGEDN